MRSRGILAAAAAALVSGLPASPAISIAAGGYRSPEPFRRSSGSQVKPYQPSHNTPHQGAREIERRRKQMERAKAKSGEA